MFTPAAAQGAPAPHVPHASQAPAAAVPLAAPLHPPSPHPGAQAAAVLRLRDGQQCAATDVLAQEVPVALEYNGISHAVMLATPADLADFALGFSLTEGIVDSPGQLYDCDREDTAQGCILHIEIAAACFARLKDRRRSLTGRTGCGLCGCDNLAQAVRPAPQVSAGPAFHAQAVLRGMASVQAHQQLQALTGATHAAAWCGRDGTLLLREDVGRHNALDKLIGALALARTPAHSGFVVVTSRASYEMVHKTAVFGAGLLAAVSGVTALAVHTAELAHLSLLGFVRGGNLSVYTGADNIVWDADHA